MMWRSSWFLIDVCYVAVNTSLYSRVVQHITTQVDVRETPSISTRLQVQVAISMTWKQEMKCMKITRIVGK